ncbi:hypothetical protein CB1_000568092 [Camelus ferus]|nr:hypothetical protein CB1_000568092 [Camelus ferus]
MTAPLTAVTSRTPLHPGARRARVHQQLGATAFLPRFTPATSRHKYGNQAGSAPQRAAQATPARRVRSRPSRRLARPCGGNAGWSPAGQGDRDIQGHRLALDKIVFTDFGFTKGTEPTARPSWGPLWAALASPALPQRLSRVQGTATIPEPPDVLQTAVPHVAEAAPQQAPASFRDEVQGAEEPREDLPLRGAQVAPEAAIRLLTRPGTPHLGSQPWGEPCSAALPQEGAQATVVFLKLDDDPRRAPAELAQQRKGLCSHRGGKDTWGPGQGCADTGHRRSEVTAKPISPHPSITWFKKGLLPSSSEGVTTHSTESQEASSFQISSASFLNRRPRRAGPPSREKRHPCPTRNGAEGVTRPPPPGVGLRVLGSCGAVAHRVGLGTEKPSSCSQASGLEGWRDCLPQCGPGNTGIREGVVGKPNERMTSGRGDASSEVKTPALTL